MNDIVVPKAEIFLLTECEISSQADLGAVLDGLRRERATGTLKVELQDGGVRHITLSKKTRAPKSAKYTD